MRSLCALLVLAALAAGCSAPPALAPDAALPDASASGTATGAAPDALPAVVPVVRLVAGRADTLDAYDLLGTDAAPAFGPHPDVEARFEAGRIVLRARAGFEGVAAIPFALGGQAYALAAEAATEPLVTFVFDPDLARPRVPPPTDVYVIGAFNDWSRSADRLERRPDGRFALTRAVPPGRYEYKFTVDGTEAMDPARPDSVANPFGAYNNVLSVRPAAEGRAGLRPLGTVPAAGAVVYRFGLWREDAAGRPVAWPLGPEHVVALVGNRRAASVAVVETAAGREVRVAVRPEDAPGLSRLRVAAAEGGLVAPWAETPLYDGRPLAEAQAAGLAPETWHDAILYQIVVDRFADGDSANTRPVQDARLDARANYHGGDLQGILDRLRAGYFDSLGVNTLWLSPLYRNPAHAHREFPPPHRYYTGYHGYWPVAPREVDPRLGDLALLRTLVGEAHARGLRVLFDFVANHVHEDHPYFRERRHWFGTLELPDGSLNLRRWDDHRLTTWFEPYLPSFDFEGAPEAIDALTADAVWWLRETGADGFRHDAVKHVPNDFWRALTARLRAEVEPARRADGRGPLYQIGETFGSYALIGSYVTPGQLDAQFNFLLYDAAIAALAREGSLADLAAEMDRSLRTFGPLHVMGNLLDSHDKPRFPALVEDLRPGDDEAALGWTDPPRVDDPVTYRRHTLALAYLLTTPGVPTVYYGNEIAKTGAGDPDNRRPMRFDDAVTADERAVFAEARALVRLRRAQPALRYGHFETLRAERYVWVYRRSTPGAPDVVVALNTGAAPAAFAAPPPPGRAYAGLYDALSGEPADPTRLAVPAGGYRILIAE
ncbi:MAG: alpha-amylase family glycosyl hydrolase [Rubricoccaceae bacterium]